MFKNNDSYNNKNNIMTVVDDQTILPIINNNINEKQYCNYLNINNNSNTTQNILSRPIEIVAAATRNSRNNISKYNEKPYNRKEVRFNIKDNPKPIQTAAMSHNNINKNNNSINNYNIKNKNNTNYSNTNANNNYNNINNHNNNMNNDHENNNMNNNNKINYNIDNNNDNNDDNNNEENNIYNTFKENIDINNDDYITNNINIS